MRRNKGPLPVGRQVRSAMAKVNQSHLLLSTVFLVLGTVVHDASTATLNKDTGETGTDTPSPTTTLSPPPTTTPSPPPTTTGSPTNEESLLSDKIWEEIKLQLDNITKTLDDLKGFVDDAPTPTSIQPIITIRPRAAPTTTTTTITTTKTNKKKKTTLRQMIPPFYFLSKLGFGIFRAETGEICTPDADELCGDLTDVLDDVEYISNKIEETDEATMDDLYYVRETTANLTDVSQGIQADESFVTDHMNVDEFNNRMDEVKEGVDAAIDDIDDKLSPEHDDNTLAIVLGTIFGILGVALIIGGIVTVVYLTKKNKRRARYLYYSGEMLGVGNPNPLEPVVGHPPPPPPPPRSI
ncbi:microtubule-associated protein RP/EB family member 1-like isoform X2 [Macrobrachium rosenbergii]|uniref:microtubule-associated protein RP/EB family member 1-like isoform X2 n=1 Tax=Macrobrachium rosenbergii TaxID=79674 RepID=UPI0034D6B7E6